MKQGSVSRRAFFKQAIGAAAGLQAGLIILRANAAGEKFARCDTLCDLSPAQIQAREALQYMDRSEKSEQCCGDCMHLQPVHGSDEPCKRCTVVPGAVHPDGWCSAWAARISG